MRFLQSKTDRHSTPRLAGPLAATVVALLLAAAPAQGAVDITSFDGGAFDLGGNATTQAGVHPDVAWTDFRLTQEMRGLFEFSTEAIKDVVVDLPPGLIGNPNAAPTCTEAELGNPTDQGGALCPVGSQIGVVRLWKNGNASTPGNVKEFISSLFNMKAPHGTTALLGFIIEPVPSYITVKARTDGDFGVTASSLNVPTPLDLAGAAVEVWGVPADPSHDGLRRSCLSVVGVPTGALCPSPDAGNPRAFFTLPTSCVGPVETNMPFFRGWGGGTATSSFLSHDTSVPPQPVGNDRCDEVPFTPQVGLSPTSQTPDGATGLDAVIDVPDDGIVDPEGVSQAHLKKTHVVLPEGVSVNPSGATGLAACSDADMGVRGYGFEAPAPVRFDNVDPFDGQGRECPSASKIGTVSVETPVLDDTLEGEVVLGEPKSTDPSSGEMFRLFLVLRSPERGLLVKVYGTAVADPQTGRLEATFDNNPQVPFSKLTLQMKTGQRALLANPTGCGQAATVASMEPWSQSHLSEDAKTPAVSESPWVTGGGCGRGFAPGLIAGMANSKGGGSGAFSFKFTRRDGEQYFKNLTAVLPPGLLASVRGIPLCKSAEAAAGACPAASRIGTVDASAGAGDPFVLEQKGDVYLTEGYKGGPYGLMVKVRAIAGPFRGAMELSPIVVRQAIHVDRKTAQVSAISDDFPNVWHGVPLRVRSVTVKLDRDRFMLNPTNCTAKQIASTFGAVEGGSANAAVPFQVTDCGRLPFKPKLALSLTGRKQVTTGKHPGVKAQVNQQGIGEAGIEKAVVRLPKSLALDPDNAQALCEFADGTKPDLENHCPKGSIVGRARAKTPLLNDDLVGNVYFVKNIRIDPKTGNQIRTLPMLIVALRGEIAINLRGESSTTKAGKLVNTFANVPDGPISQFNMNIQGGKNGILAVTRTRKAKINLCAGRHIAETDMDGQNGRTRDFDIRLKTPCTKKQTKAAKRAAKKAAVKARR